GLAWGLADRLCEVVGDQRDDPADVEGVLRVAYRLTGEAKANAQAAACSAYQVVEEAFAVCELVMVDSQEAQYGPHTASMWALEALPDLLRRAKDAVDCANQPALMAV